MKWIRMVAIAVSVLLFAVRVSAKDPVYQLSTHMLDVSQGAPAADVAVALYAAEEDGSWRLVAERRTDGNGRVGDLLPLGGPNGNDGV